MNYREFDESFSLKGKIALITGASSGIGMEIVKMYARRGADVAAFDLSPNGELEEYVCSLGRRYAQIQGDVSSSSDVSSAVEDVRAAFGRIDILVNSAGIGSVVKAEDISEDEWDKVLNINLKGSFLMSQAVGRTMLRQGGGKIVCISSKAGVVAMDGHIAYGCSKAALIHMVKQFAFEWARHNINVNAISPTVILTPLGEKHWNNPKGEAMKAAIPARRFGYPEEVAACAVFLASDAANLIHGANLVVDGGFTIG